MPVAEISGTTIYLINTSGSQYNQYMYIDGSWANLGSTSADLSSYYNKSQVDNLLLGYVSASALMAQLMFYTKTSDLAKVAKTNDYNDLDNLPIIPDASAIKPYVSTLQDSNETAPTSKVVYDAVQNIESEIATKADSSDLDDLATKTELNDVADELNEKIGKYKLLWENPNPSSTMADGAQITLSDKDVDFLEILFISEQGAERVFTQKVPYGKDTALCTMSTTSGAYFYMVARNFNYSSSGNYSVSDGFMQRSNNTAREKDNKYAIPLKVYGIKSL